MVGELREGLPSGAKAFGPAEWEKDWGRRIHRAEYTGMGSGISPGILALTTLLMQFGLTEGALAPGAMRMTTSSGETPAYPCNPVSNAISLEKLQPSSEYSLYSHLCTYCRAMVQTQTGS